MFYIIYISHKCVLLIAIPRAVAGSESGSDFNVDVALANDGHADMLNGDFPDAFDAGSDSDCGVDVELNSAPLLFVSMLVCFLRC